MDERASARERILAAATQRIKHYGYAKTTMAEIAGDCGMSAANIYRFFESKIDIAEAMARQHHAEQHARLSAIARRRHEPADQRLRELLFQRMRENYALVEAHAKILEVAEVLHAERPLHANEQFALERVYLKQILSDGVEDGLFVARDNMEFVAEMIQSSTVKFSFPQLFSRLDLPRLERELSGVVALLLDALKGGPTTLDLAASAVERV